MEWWGFLVVILALLVTFMVMGLPVAFAFAGANILGLLLVAAGTKGLVVIPGSIFSSVSSFTLVAIPMFFLLGEVLFQSKVIAMIIDVIDKWIGQLRARLLFVSIAAGTGLATLSGAGLADTALLGTTLYPEMANRGYDKRLSLGTIASIGTLASVIPPSALMVLAGSFAQVSISRLLIGGLMPGLLMAALYAVYILIRVRINPAMAPTYAGMTAPWSEKLTGAAKLSPMLLIVFMVMGFILLGVTTPSEAAATGAIAAVVIVALYRRLTFEVIRESIMGATKISAMIFLIIASAVALSQVLALSGATTGLLRLVSELTVSPLLILLAIHLMVFVLGFFIDSVSIMVIAIPIFGPIAAALGFDPIWFWVLFMMGLNNGGLTPPFGLTLFVLKSVVAGTTKDEPTMIDMYWAAVPYVFINIFAMVIVVIFPEIILWLPGLIQ